MTTMPLPLKAVTLTHVRYQRGDRLGHFLAWVSLVPAFISLGGFVSHFIFRRELQGIFFATGLIVSQFINELIKTFVQQSRPETCALLEMCDSHGWPSSHCQYTFFFATYLTLLASKGIGFSSNIVLNLSTWSLAFLTMYSRVYLGYHTVAQVFAGTALGVFLGAVWFWVVNTLLFPYFPAIEESAFGRFFYIKDTSHIPNVLKFEYDQARAFRKTWPPILSLIDGQIARNFFQDSFSQLLITVLSAIDFFSGALHFRNQLAPVQMASVKSVKRAAENTLIF